MICSEVERMNDETKTTLRIPNDLKERLKVEADRQHRSLHNLIIAILYEFANNISAYDNGSTKKGS